MAVLKIRDNNGNVTEIPALKGNNGKSPYIKNGTWWTYNDETGQWEDTGVSASGEVELTKHAVETVLTGTIDSHNHDNRYVQDVATDNKSYVRKNKQWEELSIPEVTVDSVLSNTSTNPIQNKVVYEAVSGKVDKVNGKQLSTNDYTAADKTAVGTISNKVDKVTGKQLSTNDYTTSEKNKLSGIETGAQVNVKPNWSAAAGTAAEILNKPTIPSKVSQLTNDSKFVSDATADSKQYVRKNNAWEEVTIPEITVDDSLSATSVNPIQNKVVTTALDSKVDKVTGKVLSSNDYTTEEKTKLSGIATGAQKNVQADWNATSGDAFIKNKPTIPSVDATLSATSVNPVQNKIIANALDSKVDAVAGKGLSTMDYDTTVGDLIITVLGNETVTQEQYNTIYNYLSSNTEDNKNIPFSKGTTGVQLINIIGGVDTNSISIAVVCTVETIFYCYVIEITSDLKVSIATKSNYILAEEGKIGLLAMAENETGSIQETISLLTKGTGNKYLADDGTYKSAVVDTTVGDLIISIFQDAGTTVTKEQYDTIKNYIANDKHKIIPFNSSLLSVIAILGDVYGNNLRITLFLKDEWNTGTVKLTIASDLNKTTTYSNVRIMPTSDGNISILTSDNNDDPNEITFVTTGNGTLFLSDDGTYKETATKTSQLTNDSNYVNDTTVDSKISTALTPYSTTEVNDSKYIDKTNGIEVLPRDLNLLSILYSSAKSIPESLANTILQYVPEGTTKTYIPNGASTNVIFVKVTVTTTEIVLCFIRTNCTGNNKIIYNRETKACTNNWYSVLIDNSGDGNKLLSNNGKYVIPNDNGTNTALADALWDIVVTFSSSTDFPNADATTFITELEKVITVTDTVKNCYCNNGIIDFKLSINKSNNNIFVNGVGTLNYAGGLLINSTFHMSVDSTTKKVSDGNYVFTCYDDSNVGTAISIANNGTLNELSLIANGKGTKVLTDSGEYSSLPDLFKYLRKQITTAGDLAQLSIEYLMYDAVLTSNARLGYANSLPIIGTETRVIITNAGTSNITITVPSEWKASTHSITISVNDTKLIRLNNSMSGLLVTVD